MKNLIKKSLLALLTISSINSFQLHSKINVKALQKERAFQEQQDQGRSFGSIPTQEEQQAQAQTQADGYVQGIIDWINSTVEQRIYDFPLLRSEIVDYGVNAQPIDIGSIKNLIANHILHNSTEIRIELPLQVTCNRASVQVVEPIEIRILQEATADEQAIVEREMLDQIRNILMKAEFAVKRSLEVEVENLKEYILEGIKTLRERKQEQFRDQTQRAFGKRRLVERVADLRSLANEMEADRDIFKKQESCCLGEVATFAVIAAIIPTILIALKYYTDQ